MFFYLPLKHKYYLGWWLWRSFTLFVLYYQVYEFVQVRELYYAGSHGMDIMGPAVCRNGSKAKSNNVLDQEVDK